MLAGKQLERVYQKITSNQEPRRKRTGYRSRFAPEPQIRIASPRASPQSSGEYVPYSIQTAATQLEAESQQLEAEKAEVSKLTSDIQAYQTQLNAI